MQSKDKMDVPGVLSPGMAHFVFSPPQQSEYNFYFLLVILFIIYKH